MFELTKIKETCEVESDLMECLKMNSTNNLLAKLNYGVIETRI